MNNDIKVEVVGRWKGKRGRNVIVSVNIKKKKWMLKTKSVGKLERKEDNDVDANVV